MNTLQESQNVNQDQTEMSIKTTPAAKDGPLALRKPKTPLKKEELEKIAQELKKKLSKASVAAKQLNAARSLPPDSPVSLTMLPRLSPLKNFYMWRRQIASGPHQNVTSLPNLYLPDGKLPTLTKPLLFLLSSPLKHFSGSGNEQSASRKSSVGSDEFADPHDSPIKRRRAESGAAVCPREPHMVLQPLGSPTTPPKSGLVQAPLKTASNSQKEPKTTPVLAKRQLSQNLLKTPTQPGRGDAYNDEEGADLLMYLATSPQVQKPFVGTTPRAPQGQPHNHNVVFSQAAPKSAGNQFIAPPPLTPKRPMTLTAKTPQNRLTPYGLAVPGSALPSAGLALTPAGFNMNDYVNFFTPLPGTAAHGHTGRTLLKTPDFHGQIQNGTHTSVDGKMINFDKPELFGAGPSDQAKD